MLRPLPDLTNAEAMAKLGRLSAIRSARLDALHELRDCVTRLMNVDDDLEAVKRARQCLNRLDELGKL